MRRMQKVEALKVIIADAHKEKLTVTGYKRFHRALVSLDLTEAEISDLEYHMEYRNASGQVHKFLIDGQNAKVTK